MVMLKIDFSTVTVAQCLEMHSQGYDMACKSGKLEPTMAAKFNEIVKENNKAMQKLITAKVLITPIKGEFCDEEPYEVEGVLTSRVVDGVKCYYINGWSYSAALVTILEGECIG